MKHVNYLLLTLACSVVQEVARTAVAESVARYKARAAAKDRIKELEERLAKLEQRPSTPAVVPEVAS